MAQTSDTQVTAYPRSIDQLPQFTDTAGAYHLRLAANADDLDSITKLRFEVFNLELGEGLAQSYGTCRDRDRYDEYCHHLMVIHTNSGQVVGTYRMQTGAMANAGDGFYSAEEFDLAPLRAAFLPDAVELGRACVARAHRNSRVLYLLWRGLAAYMMHNNKRYFFGCCSLTSQAPEDGWHVMALLRAKNLIHPHWHVQPRAQYACYDDNFDPPPPRTRVKLPKLMRMYMDYGARVAGPPAIDRVFKTIDYLALFDMHTLSDRARKMFVD